MSAPNVKEIEWAISELEREESSKHNYILLAALYTCRDHMRKGEDKMPQVSTYSFSQAEPLGQYGDSDFLYAVSGKEPSAAWAVMDELMETLRIVNRKVYDSVMRKMQKL